MASVINTNLNSLIAQRNLDTSQNAYTTAMTRLSSGMRINSGADDASGLAIATQMTSQVNGMNVAIRNSNDAISFSQTADGGLSSINDSLQRMREIAVQGANGTTSNASLAAEFSQLQSEITRVAGSTNFNGSNTLGATAAAGITFQVGAGTTANDSVKVTGVDLTAATSQTAIAAGATIKVDNVADSTAAITQIDSAISEISSARATYGAVDNRFTAIVSNLQSGVVNQSAAQSRIMDTDYAAETANLTRAQILQQAGTAMLAQANSQPNGVLALLRG